jgi:hypothetical protein
MKALGGASHGSENLRRSTAAMCSASSVATRSVRRRPRTAMPHPVAARRHLGQHSSRLGRYVVLATLGSGGMGTVFEAFDRTLDRRVALEVLHRDLDSEHATRLLREAQTLAKLSRLGHFGRQRYVRATPASPFTSKASAACCSGSATWRRWPIVGAPCGRTATNALAPVRSCSRLATTWPRSAMGSGTSSPRSKHGSPSTRHPDERSPHLLGASPMSRGHPRDGDRSASLGGSVGPAAMSLRCDLIPSSDHPRRHAPISVFTLAVWASWRVLDR